MTDQQSGPQTRTYEATILVKAAAARADYDGVLAAVRQTYETEGASFIELEKWEERQLAYPIAGETSALYFNAYFSAPPTSIDKIERRAQLGETIIRQLIVARPGKELELIKTQRAKQAEAAAAAAANPPVPEY
ncbi:MAG: 30S ribosomal protein S6 [Planctomycetes bacterium]|nr:30S ribosomal protein S6 [Planctomycetota bacterium]